MNKSSTRVSGSLVGIGACMVLAMAAALPSVSKEITQIAGVDNTAMGAYRALAQMSFRAFLNKDMPTAAELSRILERTWDAAEEHGGPNSLGLRNSQLFEQVDEAMDGFIKPVIHYAIKTPDPAAVKAAYEEFLKKLKQGDSFE